MAIGVFIPDKLVAILGGSSEIVKVGTPYTKIFMCFTPLFMWNYICNAFVRNDGAPSIAMAATVISSLFNIVMDWVLMFPLKGYGRCGFGYGFKSRCRLCNLLYSLFLKEKQYKL